MTSAKHAISVLLRLNAKAFEPIAALRAKYPTTPHPRAFAHVPDTIPIIGRLPKMQLPAFQARISSLASARKPFGLKFGLPKIITPSDKIKSGTQPLYGVGFECEDEAQIAQLRKDVFDDLNRHIEDVRVNGNANALFQTGIPGPASDILWIVPGPQGLDTEEKAAEIVEEIRAQYPNGFGTISAEGFALRSATRTRYGKLIPDKNPDKGVYPFGSN